MHIYSLVIELTGLGRKMACLLVGLIKVDKSYGDCDELSNFVYAVDGLNLRR